MPGPAKKGGFASFFLVRRLESPRASKRSLPPFSFRPPPAFSLPPPAPTPLVDTNKSNWGAPRGRNADFLLGGGSYRGAQRRRKEKKNQFLQRFLQLPSASERNGKQTLGSPSTSTSSTSKKKLQKNFKKNFHRGSSPSPCARPCPRLASTSCSPPSPS